MKEMKIFIEGMTCNHCIKRVTQALELAGVEEADVKIGEANIIFDENKTDIEKIAKALEDAGYKLKD
ncbi:MAG: cation transporter [Thermodesulfovibrio sp.]|uniref:heavy-metal-associated domain-containing protein n=1 Tax=Thermodesulfovibrio sp. 1176 TaxID=3043424 RepID=UPI002483214E|nr:cation transporter [Thermodesulfovibrio sp. 1176]MDI1472902.1 cation transporter [Thermodesulfovibrio sp. 1176]MDI6714858.1 cation transporter [Thermodesulfovibrio sp.]